VAWKTRKQIGKILISEIKSKKLEAVNTTQ